MPHPRAWWQDPKRRQRIRSVLEEIQQSAAQGGDRLTWVETPVGVEVYLNGRYEQTFTLQELEAAEATYRQLLAWEDPPC